MVSLAKMTPSQQMGLFKHLCLKKPGGHIAIYGQTGAGKTTTMFWLLEGLLRANPKETAVWFDLGKADESGTLLTLGPVRFLVPPNCKITVKRTDIKEGTRLDGTPFKVHDFEVVTIDDPADPWKSIKKGVINVICVYPFIIEPKPYAGVVSAMFTKLIRYAHHREIITPMTILIDEFHMLAPASGHGLGNEHYEAANMIQLNIDKLRAIGIRIIGSSQGVTKLKKGIRTAFNWNIAKRGANYRQEEEPKLHAFNSKWQKLDDDQVVVVFPNRDFTNILNTNFYPMGSEISEIDYDGEFDGLDESDKIDDRRVDDEEDE